MTPMTKNVLKPKLNKSWSVTLLFTALAAVMAIIDAPLNEHLGLEITTDDLHVFLGMFGISASAGIGNAARKQFRKPPQETIRQQPHPPPSHVDLRTQSHAEAGAQILEVPVPRLYPTDQDWLETNVSEGKMHSEDRRFWIKA